MRDSSRHTHRNKDYNRRKDQFWTERQHQTHTKATTEGQTISRRTSNIRQTHRNKDYNRGTDHIWTERQHQTRYTQEFFLKQGHRESTQTNNHKKKDHNRSTGRQQQTAHDRTEGQ